MKTKLLSFIITMLLVGNIIGQTPQAIKYQTVIRDNNGDVVSNQIVSIRLSILQGSETGAAVYVETHNDTTNQFGLVNLQAGNGNIVSGDFSTIDWGGDSYFIQTEIDATGGTNYLLAGVSEILSVPYALYAETSGNGSLWENNNDDLFYSSGSVGIGTSTPNELLSLNINSGENDGIEFQNQGSNSNGMKILYDGGALTFCSNNNGSLLGRMLIDKEDGKIGLYRNEHRTYDPAHIALDLYLRNLVDTVNNFSTIAFYMRNYVMASAGISGVAVGSHLMDITFQNEYTTNLVRESLRIKSNGRLEVKYNDVYIENIGSGVIMKSPNGQCWRVTVDNSGNFVSTAITCP